MIYSMWCDEMLECLVWSGGIEYGPRHSRASCLECNIYSALLKAARVIQITLLNGQVSTVLYNSHGRTGILLTIIYEHLTCA